MMPSNDASTSEGGYAVYSTTFNAGVARATGITQLEVDMAQSAAIQLLCTGSGPLTTPPERPLSLHAHTHSPQLNN